MRALLIVMLSVMALLLVPSTAWGQAPDGGNIYRDAAKCIPVFTP